MTAGHCFTEIISKLDIHPDQYDQLKFGVQSATTKLTKNSPKVSLYANLNTSKLILTKNLTIKDDWKKAVEYGHEDWAVFTFRHTDLKESSETYQYINSKFPMKNLENKTQVNFLQKISTTGWGDNTTSNKIIAKCPLMKSIKDFIRSCKEYDPIESKFDSKTPLPPLKITDLYVTGIGKKAKEGGQGIWVRTLIPLEKDGTVRVPEKAVSWGLLAPEDSGGPVFNSNS